MDNPVILAVLSIFSLIVSLSIPIYGKLVKGKIIEKSDIRKVDKTSFDGYLKRYDVMLSDLRAENKLLNEKFIQLDTKYNILREEKDKVEKSLNSINAQLQQSQKENIHLNQQLQSAERKIETLQAQTVFNTAKIEENNPTHI